MTNRFQTADTRYKKKYIFRHVCECDVIEPFLSANTESIGLDDPH